MEQIALNATVVCEGRAVGKCSHLIIRPGARTVTHLVVSGIKEAPGEDRTVPLERVTQSDESAIHLDCTVAELLAMPVFSVHEFVEYAYDDYMASAAMMGDPYSMPVYVPSGSDIVHEQVPEGLRALRYGATVEATDGTVGRVDQLLLDPDSHAITHFTLQEGHIWGKKRTVTLPVAAVDHADGDFIYLKLSKDAIAELPALPTTKRTGAYDRPARVELVAKVFDAPEKAAAALEEVRNLARSQRGALKIITSAIIVKDADGKITVTESSSRTQRRRRWLGAVGGGLLGALAGPVGIVVGAAAGAGIGHASAKWLDLALPEEFLDRLKGHLTPSSSALVLVVDHTYLHSLAKNLASHEGVIMQHTLTDEVVDQLLQEQQEE